MVISWYSLNGKNDCKVNLSYDPPGSRQLQDITHFSEALFSSANQPSSQDLASSLPCLYGRVKGQETLNLCIRYHCEADLCGNNAVALTSTAWGNSRRGWTQKKFVKWFTGEESGNKQHFHGTQQNPWDHRARPTFYNSRTTSTHIEI